jgi:hypothetical protein
MSTGIINLIIELVSGAAGGNIAGTLLKQYSLGAIGNSLAGIVGGGIAGQLLNIVLGGGATAGATAGAVAGGLDVGLIVEQIVGGGVGGGVLMVIVGIVKQLMGGQSAQR